VPGYYRDRYGLAAEDFPNAALDLAPPVDRLGQVFDLETLVSLKEGLGQMIAASE
jgi:hypothetical protein